MPRQVDADLCIVGAGAAGLTLAGELAARGRSVLLVERGGRHARPTEQADTMLQGSGLSLGPGSITRRFALGGAGRVWGRTLVEMLPHDFSAAPWRRESWPFTIDELQPFYDRARTLLRAEAPQPAIPTDAGDELVVVPGWRSPVHFPLEPVPGPRVRLLLGTRAVKVVAQAGRAWQVEAVTRRGQSLAITADTFVLAAGAVENAALLLLSGIGNELVGRCFADHPQILIPVGLHRSQLEGLVPGPLFHPPGAAWALAEGILRAERLPAASAYLATYRDPRLWEKPDVLAAGTFFHALYHRDLPPHPLATLTRTLRAFPDLVRVARSRSADAWLALRVMVETCPDADSRVVLGSNRDRHGLPRPEVHWRVDAGATRSVERIVGAVARLGRRRGWPPLSVPEDLGWPGRVTPGAHHMGTTRMADDPSLGVVDAECRVHGTTNLYVAGPSVFPTYGWANPMLTIVGLALRLADHLARKAL